MNTHELLSIYLAKQQQQQNMKKRLDEILLLLWIRYWIMELRFWKQKNNVLNSKDLDNVIIGSTATMIWMWLTSNLLCIGKPWTCAKWFCGNGHNLDVCVPVTYWLTKSEYRNVSFWFRGAKWMAIWTNDDDDCYM